MKKIALILVAAGLANPVMASPLDSFWTNLQALCGKAFAGTLIREPEGESSFAGQALIMHVRECRENRIRIPFVVGNDRSRTWILTRIDVDGRQQLELKHDHRHEDGSEDDVTMYGGSTTNAGRTTAQLFPADEHTRRIIEPAHANVWRVEILPGERFSYHLRRLGTQRVFQIDFSLAEPIAPPPAPWGWEDDPVE